MKRRVLASDKKKLFLTYYLLIKIYVGFTNLKMSLSNRKLDSYIFNINYLISSIKKGI